MNNYQNSFLNLSTLLRCQVRGSILSAVDSALPQQQPITAHQVCFQADGGRFLCYMCWLEMESDCWTPQSGPKCPNTPIVLVIRLSWGRWLGLAVTV